MTEDPDRPLIEITVHLSPESGLYTANMRARHPMIVKAYRLAGVLTPIWRALAAEGYFHRFPSDILVDLHERELRERCDRQAAEWLPFRVAVARIADTGHPAGSAATLDEARAIAAGAHTQARAAGRERRAAAQAGALAQTTASTDRDLLLALSRAAKDLLAATSADAPARLDLLREAVEAVDAAAAT